MKKPHCLRLLSLVLALLPFLFVGTLYGQDYDWGHNVGGATGYDAGISTDTDMDGNVVMSGNFEGTVDFDPGAAVYNLSSASETDIFVQKLDSNGQFLWAHRFGASSWDYGNAVTFDKDDNILVTGIFTGPVDFDPGAGQFILNGYGRHDIFVLKLSPAGNLIWAKAMGGARDDGGMGIVTDSQGDVIICGSFEDIADLDPSAGVDNRVSGGDNDLFVTKLSASGNYIWSHAMGGLTRDAGLEVAVDANDDVYYTGYFSRTVDADPGAGVFNLTSAGFSDVVVSKLTKNGALAWAVNVGGNYNDLGRGIAVDASNNVYVSGQYYGDGDFDPGNQIFTLLEMDDDAEVPDVFLLKLNASGVFSWAERMGSYSTDGGFGCALDAAGNIYQVGYFSSTFATVGEEENTNADDEPYYPPGTIIAQTSGGSDGFVIKRDPNGAILYVGQYRGSSAQIAHDLSIDPLGNIVVCGTFYDGIDLDPNAGVDQRASNGFQDAFVMRLHQFVPPGTGIYPPGAYANGNPNSQKVCVCHFNGTNHVIEEVNINANCNSVNGLCHHLSHGDVVTLCDGSQCGNSNKTNATSTEERSIEVFPNPSEGLFMVRGIELASEIRVLDLHGRQAMSQVLPSRTHWQTEIDLSGFPNGLYFLEIDHGKFRQLVRISR